MNIRVRNLEQRYVNNAFRQILYSRGVSNLDEYLLSTIDDINDPTAFGEENMRAGVGALIQHISAQDPIIIIVDCDADGFTASALFINYLHDLFPSFVENHIKWYVHEGKQHGLSDCVDYILFNNFKLVICPDSSSNDYEEHKKLKENGIDVLVLDHHEAERLSEDAIVINNQLSDYPNKFLSGVGVVYQFCRYIDRINNTSYANDYLDLVALGNMGDMMSLLSVETKTLIFEGFKEENIKNPFIYYMIEKNEFSLNKQDYKPSNLNGLKISPMGSAFFVTPFINAITRSGTYEEKKLIFSSMLKYEAYKSVPSTKRGHKFGEEELIVEQAIRVCTNVKNRQTKAENAGLELLENRIIKNNMLKHKVLLFLLEPGEIDRNIAGLVANKFMAKYQRPCCILTRVKKDDGSVTYEGSARGCDAADVTNFKDICINCDGVVYAKGHQGAFGLGLLSTHVDSFLASTDEILKDMPDEPVYWVDYEWEFDKVDEAKILDIASMNDYWGKNVDRSLVYIKNIPVNADTVSIMASNTLKIDGPIAEIIKFRATEEDIETLSSASCLMNAVCKCGENEWNYQIRPQLLLVDYEFIEGSEEKKTLITEWGF